MSEDEIKARREQDIVKGFFTGIATAGALVLLSIGAYWLGYYW